MADDFDPYREALVMETATLWPDEYDDWEPADRQKVEQRLHAEPDKAAHLDYIRQHTGFRRQITVTPQDLERLGVTVSRWQIRDVKRGGALRDRWSQLLHWEKW